MIRIEYKEINKVHIETKWIEETPTSSSMLGRLYMSIDGFKILKDIIEKNTTNIFRFEKKEVK